MFRETLRMNAPVGVVARRAMRDTELDGYFIPAGTQLMLGIYATQRMEPWWRDPDRFDPERFSAERREDHSHKHAWIPFGSGVHKCIGMHFGAMEVKAILHAMLLRFRWSVARRLRAADGLRHRTAPRRRAAGRDSSACSSRDRYSSRSAGSSSDSAQAMKLSWWAAPICTIATSVNPASRYGLIASTCASTSGPHERLAATWSGVTNWVAASKLSGFGRSALTFQPRPNQRNCSWARWIAASRSGS